GVLAAIFALRRRFRSAGFLVTAMAAGICMSELLKAVVTRLRPIDQLYESTGFSYPSGHSMGAAALAVSLRIIAARAHGQRVRRVVLGPRRGHQLYCSGCWSCRCGDSSGAAALAVSLARTGAHGDGRRVRAAQTGDAQAAAAQAADIHAAAAQAADADANDDT